MTESTTRETEMDTQPEDPMAAIRSIFLLGAFFVVAIIAFALGAR